VITNKTKLKKKEIGQNTNFVGTVRRIKWIWVRDFEGKILIGGPIKLRINKVGNQESKK